MNSNVNLSVIIAAFNDEKQIGNTLKSVSWVDEIIVVLAKSSIDATKEIAEKYKARIFLSENNLGIQRNIGILNSQGKWILILDTDEVISESLRLEILKKLNTSDYNGYYIPFKNHFLGHKLEWGNQKYEKRRIFKKNLGLVENLKVHPEVIIKPPVGHLNGEILHYSFRSVGQTVRKFTYYASVEAPLLYKKGERTNLKKLILYPLHMFWSLFIEEKGYRDGIWGFGLAMCFMYYEFAKYVLLLKEQLKNQ